MDPTAEPLGTADTAATEAFPTLTPADSDQPADDDAETSRFSPNALTSTLRRMSKTFEESDIPPGFMAATGSVASSAVNPPRRRSSATEHDVSLSRPGSLSHIRSNDRSSVLLSPISPQPTTLLADVAEHPSSSHGQPDTSASVGSSQPLNAHSTTSMPPGQAELKRSDTAAFANGYHFPPSYTAWESTQHFLGVFWRYTCTPVGFLVVFYGLNVVAWGGMLFLLLCNAAPAMCHPTCNDINSPRRKWMEVDQQIINALFCVTGFGLAPWRVRDLYYLMQFRLSKKYIGLQRLAGIYRSWFRLPESQYLPVDVGPDNMADWPAGLDEASIPFPQSAISRSPLTGVRAKPTQIWRMDALVWLNFSNTIFQVLLASFMWAMNRYDRPSWVTGFLVSLGIFSGIFSGVIIFVEGKRVKNIEGVPLTDRDIAKLARDRELGISHYNNLSDKKPKAPKAETEGSPV